MVETHIGCCAGEKNPMFGRTGENSPCFGRTGEKHPLFGKHHTEETRKKMSISRTGEKHPMFGKHHSDETRKKLSESHKGVVQSEETCRKKSIASSGERNGMFGKHHTQESKRSNSEKHIGKPSWNAGKICPQFTGENNSNWRGGIDNNPYSPLFNNSFKKQTRSEFGNVCFFPGCSKTPEENGRSLDVHHYDYDKNSTNCVPLCRKHNTLVNHDREFWEAYFTEAVNIYWMTHINWIAV